MNYIARWAAAFGLAALLVGVVGQSSARADGDYWRGHSNQVRSDGDYGTGYSDRDHIRRDANDLLRDEERLRNLQRLRDAQARHHDWDAVDRTDRQIDRLRSEIERERRDIHRDIDREHHRRDW